MLFRIGYRLMTGLQYRSSVGNSGDATGARAAGGIVLAHYLIVAVAVLLAHGPMLMRELVWDDILLIEHLEQTGYWRVFQPDAFGFVRPGKTLLFSAAHELFGYSSYGWQALGLIVLLAVSLLVLRFLNLWLSPMPALAAALIYAVHPLHVEGTGWFSASNGTWMALFALGYYLVFCSDSPRKLRSLVPLTTGLFLAAFLMKEEAIVLPVLAAACLWFKGVRIRRWTVVLLGFHLAAGTALTLFFRSESSRVGQTLHTFGLPEGLISFSAPRVMASHALYFFWPFRWSYYTTFSYDPVRFTLWAAVAFAVASYLALRIWRHRRELSTADLGLFFFVVGMLPLANFIPFGNDHYAVRYLTHAGLGLAILAGTGVQAASRLWSPIIVKRVVVAWTLSAIGASVLFHYHWRSTEALFRRIEQHAEASWQLAVLATWLHRNGKDQEALATIRSATKLLQRDVEKRNLTEENKKPVQVQLLVLEGKIWLRQGNIQEAHDRFQRALQIVPGNTDAAVHLGDIYDQLYSNSKTPAHFKLAEKFYTMGLDGPTNGETAHLNLGTLYAQKGEITRAVEIWRQGLRKYPGSKKLRYNLSIAARSGKTDDTLTTGPRPGT